MPKNAYHKEQMKFLGINALILQEEAQLSAIISSKQHWNNIGGGVHKIVVKVLYVRLEMWGSILIAGRKTPLLEIES